MKHNILHETQHIAWIVSFWSDGYLDYGRTVVLHIARHASHAQTANGPHLVSNYQATSSLRPKQVQQSGLCYAAIAEDQLLIDYHPPLSTSKPSSQTQQKWRYGWCHWARHQGRHMWAVTAYRKYQNCTIIHNKDLGSHNKPGDLGIKWRYQPPERMQR